VESDLAAARLEQTRIAARIEGLTAQRDALLAAVRQQPVTMGTLNGAEVEWSQLNKSRAIVEVLRRSPDPMRIGDIVRALAAVGRSSENYNGVSVYLDSLLKQKRVERVARGLYKAAA